MRSLEHLENLKHLRNLQLAGNHFNRHGEISFAKIVMQNKHLAEAVVPLPESTSLTKATLTDNLTEKITLTPREIRLLTKNMPNLNKLNLSGSKICEESAMIIAQNCQRLSILKLMDCHLTDKEAGLLL